MSDLVNVKFAILQGPIFIGGKNFDVKLDPNRYAGIKMQWSETTRKLHVTWNHETMKIPEPNVAGFVEGEVKLREPIKTHPIIAGIATTAQVETPFGHVHAGPGKGRSK